jgi:hypothetical protein
MRAGRSRIVVGPQVECWTLGPGREWAVIKRNMAEVLGSELRLSSARVYYAVHASTQVAEGPLTAEAVAARTGVALSDGIFTGQCDQRR